MIEDIKTLLEYQQLDIKLRRTFDSLEKSDPSKKMEQARAEFNNAKKNVLDSEKEAEAVVANLNQTTAQIKEYADKLNELTLIMENAEPDDDLGSIVGQLESLKSKVVTLEKRLAENRALSEKLVKSYQEANVRGLKMRKIFDSAKLDYNELRKKYEPEIHKLKEQLKALEPKINPDLMAKYKSITADNKYPAFVEVHVGEGGAYSCQGCGLQLSAKNMSTLNENGQCTCETCRRIIYKNQ